MAVTAAGDALCALQLGVASSDRALLYQARSLYGKALRHLQVDVQRAHQAKLINNINSTVSFLAVYELLVSSSFDAKEWQHHAQGLLRLYNSHESKSDTPGPAGWVFLQLRYTSALAYGLLSKKGISYRPPPWRDTRYPMTALVMRVPTHLEQLEACRNLLVSDAEDIASMVLQALTLREEMRDSLIAWSLTADRVPYHTTSIDVYKGFRATVGDLSAVFPTAYSFSDWHVAQLHRTFWTCLLELDQAIVDVRGLHWDALQDINGNELDMLGPEIRACADHLCQCMPYFSSSEVNTAGPMSMLEALHFLQLHFARYGKSRQLAWCMRLQDRFLLGRKIARMLKED